MKTLVLTNERRKNGVCVIVHGFPVWLTVSQFRGLAHLVIARIPGRTGYVCDLDLLYPKAVFALRRAIDRAGKGVGQAVIESGLGQFTGRDGSSQPEYRLAQLSRDYVALRQGIQELVDAKILTPQELAGLRAACDEEVTAG